MTQQPPLWALSGHSLQDELESALWLSGTKKESGGPRQPEPPRSVLCKLPVDDVVSQHLPVMVGIAKALFLRCPVFSGSTRKPALVLDYGRPLFEGVDVRDQHGSRIPSTIARFCSSLMPAE